MRNILKVLGSVVGMAVATGCSIDSSLFGVKAPEVSTPQVSRAAEIVSGSTQYETTAGGYKVNASVGSVYDEVSGTTSGGYKVFVTVQGQIISED